MKDYLNPLLPLKVAKCYLSDVDRVWCCNKEQLRAYQDKALRRMVKYAYTVPVYHKKYKKAGIYPQDIKGIKDLEKLPFITKDDLRQNYPDGIISKKYNKNNGFLVSTSGSTGKPVFVYIDMFSAIKSLTAFVRTLKAYGGRWNKTRIVMIVDTTPGSVEHAIFTKSAIPVLQKLMTTKNIKYIDIAEKPEIAMKEMEEFNPEFVGTDPNMLRKLAILKNEGIGKNVNPEYLGSAGAMLDKYTRNYVEKAFGAQILDSYASTEAGPIAFECIKGGYYHVHSDFVYLEFLDEENKPVDFGIPGNTVITKFYGTGTPIIRYTGISDLVVPVELEPECGITTQMIKQIEGRTTDLLIMPDGKPLSPLTVTGIPAKTMEYFKTYKIKQFQIVQHKVDEIEVKIVIDEKLRNKGVPVKDILIELEKRFSKAIGNKVNITVNEVDSIQKDVRTDYVQVVISKVKPKI
jgi:phenylacetate-CoA ligase